MCGLRHSFAKLRNSFNYLRGIHAPIVPLWLFLRVTVCSVTVVSVLRGKVFQISIGIIRDTKVVFDYLTILYSLHACQRTRTRLLSRNVSTNGNVCMKASVCRAYKSGVWVNIYHSGYEYRNFRPNGLFLFGSHITSLYHLII